MHSCVPFRRPFQAVAHRRVVHVSASAIAPPVSILKKDADGNCKGTTRLALKVADDATANGLVHRYMVMVLQNARRGTASTLTRGEVRGGGRKPYPQKGTGQARRGSNRSPLIRGGGVIFGPKPKDWSIKMNKKERRLALATALQSSTSDMMVIESLTGKVEDKKTKSLLAILEKVGANPMERKVLLVTREVNEDVVLAGRNVPKLAINTASAIRVMDVLHADRIVVEQEALDYIQSFYGDGAQENMEAPEEDLDVPGDKSP